MKITPIAKEKKYCQMVNDMVFTKCGLSIDHENQNIFFKWIKQETKDEKYLFIKSFF